VTVFEILTQLRNLDVKLWLEGDRLHYRAPQGALTAGLRSAIAARKAEILAFLREIETTAVKPPLVALPRTGPLPLSYAQERLWFLDQWSPGGFAYNVPQAVRLAGGLDRTALARGLTEVVRRHETLRTAFPVADGGRPIQVIGPPPAVVPLPLVDLAGLPADSREPAARALVAAEAQRPFDLARGPLLAAFLLRLEGREHVLLLNLHHIVSDGWSTGVLIRELGALYQAFVAEQPSPLPELPLQYADFAQWQRRWLSGDTLAQHLAYWRERLAGAPGLLELPADRPRPPVQSFRGASLFFTLETPLSETLRSLAQREGATLFMVLLAAFDVLLSRATGQEDLVLGTPIANRNQTEIEGLIGFFVNTLALRADLSGDPTFTGLMAQVRETTLGAYAHQDLPFEKLVEELKPERDPSYTPIFQTLFVLQNAPLPAIALPGLCLAPLAFDGGTAKFDLTLGLMDGEPALTGWIEYNTDLFDPPTAGRLLAHWRNLLAELAASPERRLSELRVLPTSERHQVLAEWNDTAVLETLGRPSLSVLLRQQVERTPDAVAVCSAGESLSYRALDRSAGTLARRLRGLGCGPQSRIAVAMERSAELVVALLGILRAGATYVPLDPGYPKERLAFMLADSRPAALLTQERSAARLPEPPAALPVLHLDGARLAGMVGDSGEEPEGEAVQGDPFAYMIYTSGSTGQPKGALVRRNAFAGLVGWYVAELGMSSADRLLLLSSASFDLTQKNFFAPLLVGGELHLAPSLYDPAELRHWIERHQITRINCTPSAFYPLAEEGDPVALATLLSVALGGEPIALDRLDHWRRSATCRAVVINSYGPTECTDVVAFHRLAPLVPPDAGEPQGVPLGRPIPGARLWIAEGDGEPAPIGVPGELWIGGECVGGGYLGDPVRTAQKFLPDPWTATPGSRAYRTGDLARRRAGGEIDYLGRIDLQVKVRGFRIELGEIESRLSEHPAVREAAVAVRGSGSQARLVAYLVPMPEEAPQPTAVRSFLLERLPESMVPNLYMILEKLPLSPNGKLDRRQLPEPDPAAGSVGSAAFFVAPRSGTEEYLAGLWSEVLGVERVGAHDNFFDLGGHSMIAAQLVARLRGALAVEIPLRAFFDAPTLAGLAGLVEAARETGREIENRPPTPVPRGEGSHLPLSYSQERLWLFERMVPGTPAYNNYRAARIAGLFDPLAAERAVNELLRRHEVLRTTYAEVDGRPIQIVHPHRDQLLPWVDLTALPPETRATVALTLANQDARIPVPLTVSPVLRATLLRLGPEDHVFILTLHHIVYDIWSGWVLLGDLEALYTAFRDGLPSPLPELPIQYADFAYWQRRWLEGAVLEEQLAYWRAQLDGAQPLELPTDRPRGARASHRGGAETLVFSGPLLGSLRALARQGGATLFMTLLAAWNALFYREVGQGGGGDVPIGSPLANRTHSETEGLLGFFVNTAVLRTRFGAGATFRQLLAATREVSLGAYAHQDLPFEKVIDEMPPERRATLQELYRVVFAFIANYPALTRSMAGLSLTPLRLHSGAVHFDLTLLLAERDGGIHGFLEYSVDLFDGPTVARLLGRFRTVIAAGVADPDCAVGSLPLLTPPERHQALLAWNDTAIEYPERPLVHERFTAHARRRPAATAILSTADGDRRRLTYGEVEARSNRLAHFLRFLGVGPEVMVAICTERTLDRVVAIVAVLKAGGAYVSLDPTYPRERLAYLLADSGAPVLLTEERFAPDLPESEARVIRLDADWDRVTGPEAYPPASGAGPENLAYVVYTSGSTGKPKGVAIPHAGLTNLVYWHQGLYGVTAEDRGTQIASPAFDASVWELWPYLAAGACLHVPDEATRLSSAGMIRWWAEEGITLAYLMTPLAEGVLEEVIPEGLDLRVRSLIIGGDRLHRGPAPGVGFRLMNHYGPAEYTVTSTVIEVPPRGEATGLPTIGRPVDNTRISVLDPRGELAPVGVPGELYVAGIGLARGYHRRPDLTAEKFVPSPWGEPGERMYRTGDLVRRLPDGDLDFLGRLDHQVKVRGLRIELGEIEAVLGQHLGLREAAVVVREDRPGDRRLVAYVVPASEPSPPSAMPLQEPELRIFLSERLPAYLVPAAFVFLGALPLTPNGKVDRRALPAPEIGTEEAYVAPRGPVEELLAGIFAELLHRERVGADESFFALGGHSLLAVQALSRVRRAFGVEPPIHRLFEAPTVAGLAHEVEAALAAGRGTPTAPPLVAVVHAGPPPLSFAQERLWLLDQLAPGSPAYNLPGAFRLLGTLDLPALAASLREVVRRHSALRTRFALADGRPVQVIAPSPDDILPFLPELDLAGLPAASRERETMRLVQAEALRPFDLAKGPLLRVRLLRLGRPGEDEHLAFFSMHHIVSDAWSMGVLCGEIAALYGAFSQGRPSQLPELPLQYAGFALWQRTYLAGAVLEAELAYWRDALAGAQTLELPTDRPRPAAQSFRGATVSFALEAPLSAALRALAQREGATLFMLLLAAWQTLLRRYTGQDDIVVGSPIAGRNRLETEGLIGFFINALVLRATVTGDPLFRDLLAQVREISLGAYAHHDFPFERLVEELAPQRDLGRPPLFQVVFALQNAPMSRLELPGLTLEPLAVTTETAKFDLTLSLAEEKSGLAGALEYNRDLFDRTTTERMVAHLERLLAALGECALDPAASLGRLSELPLLAPAERAEALYEWNDMAQPCPQVPLVHQLFSQHARLRPSAPAITSPRGGLTYGELDARSNRLAHQLVGLGVGPEVRVAICTERTPERLVAVVAVLKAGGAYVSLDPTYPRERLAFLLDDSGAPVLLTEERFAPLLPDSQARVIRLDADWDSVRGSETEPPAATALPDNIAYVVYTSGSTGRPKGVEIPHSGLMNLVRWHQRLYDVRPEDRGTQIASPAFDASIWELWPYLAGGASVHVPEEEIRLSSSGMLRWWGEQGITLAYLMTPLAEGVLEEPLPSVLDLKVRALIIGGDRLHRGPDPRAGFRLMNHYGPAEYSVTSTVVQVPPRGTAGGGLPTIGRPVDNTWIYILGQQGEPVPVGVPGELYLSGMGLARGYLGRPDLTAEKFLPDPFAAERGEIGARMYRTADLVRRLPDGDLDFLGRLDHQVKVRGLRIELGEIETVLGQHPGIREAAVLVREDRPGDKRLVAYVVAAGEPVATATAVAGEDLRGFLSERLPAYMVPAAFVFLDAFPLTPNGKVDRRALPAPQADDSDFLPPRTRLELELAGIWEELLDLRPIGVRDNFFALGGHSLLAVRLLTRIEERYGRTLPLTELFRGGTIEELAQALTRVTPTPSSPLVPLRATGARPPLFLVHPVGGGALAYRELAELLGPEQPVYGLQARGLEPGEEPIPEIEEMARIYLDAVRAVQPQGPYALAGWSFGGLVAFAMARQLEEVGESARLILLDTQAPGLVPAPEVDDAVALALFAAEAGLPWEEPETLATPTKDEPLARLATLAERAQLLPRGAGEAHLRRRLAVFKTHGEAARRYVPGFYGGRLTLLRAGELATPEAAAWVERHPDYGWGAHAPAVDLQILAGGHFTLLREPSVASLAELLRGLLA
jgi:amino acid adenylation domain-containing protein